MKPYIRPVGLVFLVALILHVGARQVGPVPPLGGFLDPVNGVWAVARSARPPAKIEAKIPGLTGPVRVLYDSYGVPHIFASTIEDAYRAQGYVIARDRLFELELQIRATDGTLTELVGSRALPADRFARKLGLAESARKEFASYGPGSPERRRLEAYAEGINAYIDQMGPEDLPFEYRLLHAKPFRWKPEYPVVFTRRMGLTLAYTTNDLRLARVADRIGLDAAAGLFPEVSPIQEPIEPNGLDRTRIDTILLPAPDLENEVHAAPVQSALKCVVPAWCPETQADLPAASNNWAVAPSRSATGHALLAGDPHLELTLPSVWYEIHLLVPGELDVYGVTFAGTPGVVLGFNRDIAWSFTNTGSDAIDYYRETLDRPDRPTRYLVDGEWRDLEQRVEEYYGKDGRLLFTDTLYATHRGPLMLGGDPLSFRWTVLEEGANLAVFSALDRARSVKEWLTAMESFNAPAQNGVVADRAGNIAIRSNGRFPVRAGNGSGRVIRDGSHSENDWQGSWPVSRYPFSLNPERGFVFSANQQPLDPRIRPGYLGYDWPSPWRAMQIAQLLRSDSNVTPDDMRRFQTSAESARAELFGKLLLEIARDVLDGNPDRPALAEAVELLADWDFKYSRENERAILFEYIMSELSRRTWDELQDTVGRRVKTPAAAILYELLLDPDSEWWDVRSSTDRRETREDIVVASIDAALARAKKDFGPPDGGGWRWDEVRKRNIYHLARIPGLSRTGIRMDGGPATNSPLSGRGTHGASWRMVVDLGDEVTASVTYPGGQSGNPVSTWYDDRIEEWISGSLHQALFPHGPGDLADSLTAFELRLTGVNER